MKQVQLSQSKIALVDDEDFGKVSDHTWSVVKCKNSFYARTNIRVAKGKYGRKVLYMHKLILATNDKVDHIDNNGLNNQRSNLRVATASQNGHNSRLRSDSSTGYKGVNKLGENRYRAFI